MTNSKDEIGFPEGQYIPHGVDLESTQKLSDAYWAGEDPQPIIDSIEDPEIRETAQRITRLVFSVPLRGERYQ